MKETVPKAGSKGVPAWELALICALVAMVIVVASSWDVLKDTVEEYQHSQNVLVKSRKMLEAEARNSQERVAKLDFLPDEPTVEQEDGQ